MRTNGCGDGVNESMNQPICRSSSESHGPKNARAEEALTCHPLGRSSTEIIEVRGFADFSNRNTYSGSINIMLSNAGVYWQHKGRQQLSKASIAFYRFLRSGLQLSIIAVAYSTFIQFFQDLQPYQTSYQMTPPAKRSFEGVMPRLTLI